MIMIQDDPMPTGADKPLRITGDPHKVQVSCRKAHCVLPFVLFVLSLHILFPQKISENVWLILSILCKVCIFGVLLGFPSSKLVNLW